MHTPSETFRGGFSRRRFLGSMTAMAAGVASLQAAELSAPPVFSAESNQFSFDTGVLRGALRLEGRSLGLRPVADSASGAALSGAYGLLSHYRLLDAEARYGSAAWDWTSTARRLPDGAVEATWTADAQHPFDLKAVYRWKAAGTLDVLTTVTARKSLRRMEIFLASYFAGFPASLVYTTGSPQSGGKPGFTEATKAAGVWQMFPRDEAAVQTIGDGRWKRPPNPVDWTIMPRLAGPLAMRRDDKTGLVALIMAPQADCFAVATPFGEEGHRSLYFSLLGRDLKAGETATARTRLVLGRAISAEHAIAIFDAYQREAGARD